jgi:hypothetical protein
MSDEQNPDIDLGAAYDFGPRPKSDDRDPGRADSVKRSETLVALRDRLSNPLIVELTAFESLRTAVG